MGVTCRRKLDDLLADDDCQPPAEKGPSWSSGPARGDEQRRARATWASCLFPLSFDISYVMSYSLPYTLFLLEREMKAITFHSFFFSFFWNIYEDNYDGVKQSAKSFGAFQDFFSPVIWRIAADGQVWMTIQHQLVQHIHDKKSYRGAAPGKWTGTHQTAPLYCELNNKKKSLKTRPLMITNGVMLCNKCGNFLQPRSNPCWEHSIAK